MARTIGKAKINRIKALVKEFKAKGCPSIREAVRAELPSEWWDIWEMADQEIDRVIWDEIFNN